MLKVLCVGFEYIVPDRQISSEVAIISRVMPVVVMRVNLEWNKSPYTPREVISTMDFMGNKYAH